MKGKSKKLVLIAAGGTGGHINSALALGERFLELGFLVTYVTGKRYLDYQLFKNLGNDDASVIHLEGMPLKTFNPLKLIKSLIKNFLVLLKMIIVIGKNRPEFAIGAGGYVCGPVLLAAFLQRRPVYIIEQNSVLGLTNKILLFFSDKMFLHFRETLGIPLMFRDRLVISGNPVRKSVLALRKSGVKEGSVGIKNRCFNILVFGGSLGATSINNMIREFLSHPNPFTFKIHIKHQTGKESSGLQGRDKEEKYSFHSSIIYEQFEYLYNIENEYIWSDLIICRSGASTISELRMVEKSVILIPYMLHKDKHQVFNAHALQEEVAFNVYVKTCEELQKNQFEVFKNIIVEETGRSDCKETCPSHNHHQDLTATESVIKEILGHV